MDFLILRAASGEIESELAQWWSDFSVADNAGREILLSVKQRPAKKAQITAKTPSQRAGVTTAGTGTKTTLDNDPHRSNDSNTDDMEMPAPKKRRRRPKKPAVISA